MASGASTLLPATTQHRLTGVLVALQRACWQGRAQTVATRQKRGGSSVARGQRVDADLTRYVRGERKGFIRMTREVLAALHVRDVELTTTQREVIRGAVRGQVDAVGRRDGRTVVLEVKSGFGRGRTFSGKMDMAGPMAGVPDTPQNRHWLQVLTYYEMLVANGEMERAASECWVVTVWQQGKKRKRQAADAGGGGGVEYEPAGYRVLVQDTPPRWWTRKRRQMLCEALGIN